MSQNTSFNAMCENKILAKIYALTLSKNVGSGSEITPCNKIEKKTTKNRFFGKCYDAHNDVVHNDKPITLLRQIKLVAKKI